MAQKVDMLETYYRKACLPTGLQQKTPYDLPEQVMDLYRAIESGTYAHRIIVLSGLKPGKTVSAAALLRAWLKARRDVIEYGVPGYFLQVHQLCYQNRSIDRYRRDDALQEVIRTACRSEFLVLDGIFSYLTQNDDLLLQSIYDARQHSCKTTIITTSITDPLACAGSVLYRMFRDADIKISF